MIHKIKRVTKSLLHRVKQLCSQIFFQGRVIKAVLSFKKDIFVFLPTIDWKTPLYQRPQHLAMNISKRMNIVYGTHNYSKDAVWGIKKISKKIIITNLWRDVLRIKPQSSVLLLSTQQLISVKELKEIIRNGGRIVYDYVDEIHHEISGSKKMENFLFQRHEYIKKSQCAHLVLCVSKKLYDEMLEFYPKEKVLLVPNGVDYDHFQIAKNYKKIPADIQKIVATNQPIIGYYGAMAQWLDYDIINTTAKRHPDWQFIFIGVNYNGGLQKLDQSLPNIHFLGQKDYQDLPLYGVWFDIALIPFARGEIAKSTSPLKMYEYMAMRKPIVATQDLLECYGYKGVFIAKNSPEDFAKNISEALKAAHDTKTTAALDQAARKNTWAQRAQLILKKVV